MSEYYDDNFGNWNIEDEDDIRFYNKVQKESIWKICSMCDEKVKLKPEYDKCDSCMNMLESGRCI